MSLYPSLQSSLTDGDYFRRPRLERGRPLPSTFNTTSSSNSARPQLQRGQPLPSNLHISPLSEPSTPIDSDSLSQPDSDLFDELRDVWEGEVLNRGLADSTRREQQIARITIARKRATSVKVRGLSLVCGALRV